MTAPAQTQQAPPPPDQTVQHVAELILAGGAAALLAAAIFRLLRRGMRPVTLEGVTLAVTLSERGTTHQPRMRGRSDVARAQRRQEATYRAAYIVNAARRLSETLGRPPAGEDPADRRRRARASVGKERAYWQAHERARRARMDAAVAVADSAERHGPLLGWHAWMDDRVTPECAAADGTNFDARTPPAIGYPGTPHGGTCRCVPGLPFPGAPSTDAATAHLLGMRH